MDDSLNELSKEFIKQLNEHFDLFCSECGCAEVEVGVKDDMAYSIHEEYVLYFRCLACENIIEFQINC